MDYTGRLRLCVESITVCNELSLRCIQRCNVVPKVPAHHSFEMFTLGTRNVLQRRCGNVPGTGHVGSRTHGGKLSLSPSRFYVGAFPARNTEK